MRNLIAVGIVCETLWLILATSGDLRTHLYRFIGIYALQFGLMIWAWRHSVSMDLGVRRHHRTWAVVILFFSVLFRLTWLPTTPSLSDDIYRYRWEGRVQRAGFSPYEHAPESHALQAMRDPGYELINHKRVASIYPPLTQIAFRIGIYLSDGMHFMGWGESSLQRDILGQKIVFLVFDLLLLVVIMAFLQVLAVPRAHAILYAWNPLVIVEISGSGHNDSMGLFFLMLGIYLWQRGRAGGAALNLAASFLSKYTAIMLAPYFLWRRQWKTLAWFLIPAAGGLYFIWDIWPAPSGGKEYAAHWQFNGSLFWILTHLMADGVAAKLLAAALLMTTAVAAGKRSQDLAGAARITVAAALLLAPTVHPWYFIWLVPLLCLSPSRSFLIWNATIVLSYTVHLRFAQSGVWNLHPAIWLLEYLPVYLSLLWDWRFKWGSRTGRAPVKLAPLGSA